MKYRVIIEQDEDGVLLHHIDAPFRKVVIPDHKEVAKGALRGIIRQVGVTLEKFSNLL